VFQIFLPFYLRVSNIFAVLFACFKYFCRFNCVIQIFLTLVCNKSITMTLQSHPLHLFADRCRRETAAPIWDGLKPLIFAAINHWKSTLQTASTAWQPSAAASNAAVCLVQSLALLSSLVVHRNGAC
jgi:hypothetical protein